MANEMKPTGPAMTPALPPSGGATAGDPVGSAQGANEEVSWEAAFDDAAAGGAARSAPASAEAGPHSAAGARNRRPGVETEEVAEGPLDINFLLDIPLNVTVEIGRTRMVVNDLLQLGQGSVIPLDKLVGEPFEVLVNQKLMARGEVVVVNEKFGVRLTDIIDPKERIQQLG